MSGKSAITMHDLDVMARTIFGEARNQPYDGQLAIAYVILNRWRSPRWFSHPSISGVCLKQWQFSCWNVTDPNKERIERASYDEAGMRNALRAALQALDKPGEDHTKGSTHYYAPKVVSAPKWAKDKTPVAKIGDHDFYSNID